MFWNAGRLKSSRVALVTNDFPLEMFELLDGSWRMQRTHLGWHPWLVLVGSGWFWLVPCFPFFECFSKCPGWMRQRWRRCMSCWTVFVAWTKCGMWCRGVFDARAINILVKGGISTGDLAVGDGSTPSFSHFLDSEHLFNYQVFWCRGIGDGFWPIPQDVQKGVPKYCWCGRPTGQQLRLLQLLFLGVQLIRQSI